MAVGVLRIELRLLSPRSLKEKRAILRPVKEYLRRKKNVSVAETGSHDAWQSSVLEIAMVSNDRSSLHGELSGLVSRLEARFPVSITSQDLEIL
ncbi:MAG: DUF503 domain-containing protein [Fidelibacterota bacterium]